jgi:phosphopantetheine--protein transferase-like protein
MIGIDVVDLVTAATKSNWRRKGYLDKIFTKEEQAFIQTSSKADEMVWLLWSMKEAAYKIYSPTTNTHTFAPTSLVCTNLHISQQKAEGLVSISGFTYPTKSNWTSDYMLSIAALTIDALNDVRPLLYVKPFHIVYQNTQAKSVSHHGRYLVLVY